MEDIKWCPQHGYPLPCDKCGMPLSELQQKEIYQAGYEQSVLDNDEWCHDGILRGRKEVVEWIERHIDERIDFLRSLTGLFDDSYDKELRRGILELDWVRRMTEDRKEEK